MIIKKIQEIHRVKFYFYNAGISIVLPIENEKGRTFFEFEGAYYAIFPYIADSQVDRGELSPQQIISLGQTLAQVHLAGRDANLNISSHFKGWNIDSSLETLDQIKRWLETKPQNEIEKAIQKTIDLKRKLINGHKREYEELGLKNDHLIHGDYLDHNVFFGDEQVSYVFDLEKAEFAPRTHELFRSATYSFLNTDFDERSFESIKIYLEAYLDKYPMNKEEFDLGWDAHYWQSVYGLWVQKEYCLENNKKLEVFVEPHYQRLVYLTENLDRFKKILN